MKVAVIGPLCKDVIIIRNESHIQPGGVTYYTGNALGVLGVETTVICTMNKNDRGLLNSFYPSIDIRIIDRGNTIKFITY